MRSWWETWKFMRWMRRLGVDPYQLDRTGMRYFADQYVKRNG